VNPPSQIVAAKIAAYLRWEKRKRWECIAASIACYALAISCLVGVLTLAIAPVWIILGALLLIAPVIISKQRWITRDVTQSLAQLDKTMRLEARALTAWELLPRRELSGTGQLVMTQASERLSTLDVRKLFPRRRNWQAYAILPLLGLWLLLLWFDFGAVNGARGRTEAQTLAHKLREFSRQLQERAQAEGLKQSLQAGKELEKLAQRGLEQNTSDAQMQKDISGAAQNIASASKQTAKEPSTSTDQSEQSLRDLKAELEAARDLFNESGPGSARNESLADRLASLPQLKRQLDRQAGGKSMAQNEMKAFLDKMENQVTTELDRRTLLDAEQYLKQMAKQAQGQGEANAPAAGPGRQDAPEDGEKGPNQSNRPGTEPGKKRDELPTLPQFAVGPSTQVKGMIGEGESNAMVFKSKPTAPGKSALSQEELVTSYRRQAEQDLNSERVPEALKETIRNYFLSLGEGK